MKEYHDRNTTVCAEIAAGEDLEFAVKRGEVKSNPNLSFSHPLPFLIRFTYLVAGG